MNTTVQTDSDLYVIEWLETINEDQQTLHATMKGTFSSLGDAIGDVEAHIKHDYFRDADYIHIIHVKSGTLYGSNRALREFTTVLGTANIGPDTLSNAIDLD